jgi:mono/diheme cytochrome c family protein
MLQTFIAGAIVLVACLATGMAQVRGTVLDGVYTHAQAQRGEAAYHAACAGCHEGQDADGPELAGRVFMDRWREDSLEPLFRFMKTRMPGQAPGSLEDRVYADILAFVLEANDLPSGTTELMADAVGAIQLVGVDGPKPLANLTIVRAVGCLSQEGTAWALVKAGPPRPIRDRIVNGTTPEELKVSAGQALGGQSFPLLSVPRAGASLAGHKVQVKGVLNRQNTLERINVMSLESVAPTCGG